MAGLKPSFASGSNLAIWIDGQPIAFATNLSISDSVPHAAIGGIGGYSYSALEPLAYTVNGSFTITRYSKLSLVATTADGSLQAPTRTRALGDQDAQDGNSMLMSKFFNPLQLMVNSTFDIIVYERQRTAANFQIPDTGSTAVFRIEDCRLTDYALSFTPGSVVAENIGFIGLNLIDLKVSEAEASASTQQAG